MPKASEVAAELRKLADSLYREPDVEIESAWISFYCPSREVFLNTANLLPHPLRKEDDQLLKKYVVIYGDPHGPLQARCMVDKSLACRLIRPAQEAVYECLPILSEAEEAALETAVSL